MIALAEALKPTDKFPMGALGKLEGLSLAANEIGDEGMAAFAEALKPGSLPKLANVYVGENPGNGMGLEEACSARGIKCIA